MATILKVQVGNDIRRLNITHFSTYAEFAQLVRTIFNISELSGLQLMYQDEDKDFINIRSDLDMAEARRFAEQLPSFKIHAILSDGLSPSPSPSEPLYPQVAPEDIDLTSSFAELLTESMKVKEEESITRVKQESSKAPAPAAPVDPEVAFHQSLNELSQAQQEPGVMESMEAKLKRALEALVHFVESLHLDQKVKQLVSEFEPTFAKFESRVIHPLNELGARASRGLQQEMSTFQHEINDLKDRLQSRLAELRAGHPSDVSPSGPAAENATSCPTDAPITQQTAPQKAPSNASPQRASSSASPAAPQPLQEPVNVGHNAIHDLQCLELMGFTDRRRNLELLAKHKGDINAVVEVLLA